MDDDERLGALIDQELNAEAQAALQARLRSETGLAQRLDQLRRNDADLRAAFDEPMVEPVPAALLALLPAPAPVSVPGSSAAANDNDHLRWGWAGAVAASLLIGLFIGARFLSDAANRPIESSVAFNQALDRTASGVSAPLEQKASLTPRLTYATRSGVFCRQFDLTGGTGEAQSGIACREGGRWSLKALLPAVRAAGEGGYAVAEGPDDAGLDAVVDRSRVGDPLGAAAESAMIRRNWRPR